MHGTYTHSTARTARYAPHAQCMARGGFAHSKEVIVTIIVEVLVAVAVAISLNMIVDFLGGMIIAPYRTRSAGIYFDTLDTKAKMVMTKSPQQYFFWCTFRRCKASERLLLRAYGRYCLR